MGMDNKGTSLVEVIAGFLMIAVIMVSFIKIINLSSEMTTVAVDTKNNNLEFEKTYYDGYNYLTKYGTNNNMQYAFREDMSLKDKNGNVLEIVLTEWQKEDDGEFFKEWHKGSDGKFVSPETDENGLPFNDKTLKLSNVKINRIENVKDLSKARISVFRFQYTKPVS